MGDTPSQLAYDQAVADGLRRRLAPDEFLEAVKFKAGATAYFATKDQYLQKISAAELQDNVELARQLRDDMNVELRNYRLTHPIFAERLNSADARQRRQKAIEQMRTIVADPQAPATPSLETFRLGMDAWDTYQTKIAMLSTSYSAKADADKEYLQAQFDKYMSNLMGNDAATLSWWQTILRPEAGFD
jgi:hypothetical protein